MGFWSKEFLRNVYEADNHLILVVYLELER